MRARTDEVVGVATPNVQNRTLTSSSPVATITGIPASPAEIQCACLCWKSQAVIE